MCTHPVQHDHSDLKRRGGREGGREGGKEGGKKERREGGREEREGGREGGKEEVDIKSQPLIQHSHIHIHAVKLIRAHPSYPCAIRSAGAVVTGQCPVTVNVMVDTDTFPLPFEMPSTEVRNPL